MVVTAVRQFDPALGQRAGGGVRGPRRQRWLVRRRTVGRRRRQTRSGLRGHHARLDTEHAVRVAEPCRRDTETINDGQSQRKSHDNTVQRYQYMLLCTRYNIAGTQVMFSRYRYRGRYTAL